MSILEIKNLSKLFGKQAALEDVSFKLEEGEILGFIGPNGAGKSTTIKIILGMLKATKGSVTLFGKDAWNEAVEVHKRIAYVPGDVNLWPNLTGGEVIDLFLSMRGVKVETVKKEELMKEFEFDPTKKCRSYSKGNRQKVALIAAFAADADLYILDEPTSGLDPLQERVFQEHIKKVKEKGASVLLSSHILSEVEQLCDTVAIIRKGKIVESGNLDDLRHLTRTQVKLQVKEAADYLQEKNYIHEFIQEKDTVFFQLDSNHTEDLIQEIQGLGVLKFESTPSKLEDLFMRHYSRSSEGDV
ncbi:ABC transporter ATP-binding protein [Marinilactibacillus psychrotolerans]|uniref:ABC transporter ATP-binding protein n=1 Tax=Marinilactibacillus psychrotolerans TaxID=191770 RepID=A0AAV3WUC1_9LACT|nr:ABC transporter ATP-binding protein [Marinilactibacillus psychrotolerans]GEL67330.1 ABC transporter ATP-binding protein [Marinilactibacillus psychrotolerans]GEQ36273.1 ABC transporter ATP-binding protein [Marinilactibacillus psychrotolerans]SDC93321.1 ABC-2 type transport system ATP-binding protein [Marinilactibacillus psychrotolerans]